MIGRYLAHYEILSAIGKGGMGEVWRARDTKLGREVAIKTLPEEFARDADRLARFEREARLLATLNHPHIAAIHGLEEHDGTRFLVLELVDGPTLADRIREGAIPVEESLDLALQIGEALEAAHGKGVIHRDLKPANIKLTKDGQIKVLDFGLAKAYAGPAPGAGASQSPTLSMAATQQGLILGTAAYMSPEQARGQEVDQRTDVWAFGCVLYEMLTGRAAFPGADATDILAAVVRAEPEWSALPAEIHPRLRELVERCLAKDAKSRWQHIGDVRIDLERLRSHPPAPEPAVASTAPSLWRRVLPWAVAVAAAASLLAVILRLPPADPGAIRSTSILLPPDQTLTGRMPFVLSPDGRLLVYTASTGDQPLLYERPLVAFESRPIAGTEGAELPFFSPDGRSVGFFAGGRLKTVSLDGGLPTPLANAAFAWGGAWGADGSIVFSPTLNRGLWRVSEEGENLEQLTAPDFAGNGYAHVFPQFLPGVGQVLFTAWGGTEHAAAVLSLDTNEWDRLLPSALTFFLPAGHLLFDGMDRQLSATAFDASTLRPGDRRVGVLSGIAQYPGCCYLLSTSGNGTLAYLPPSPPGQAVWVDRDGQTEPPAAAIRSYRGAPRLAPGGARVAVQPEQVAVIDVVDIASGRSTRVQPEIPGFNSGYSAWMPDGRTLVFASNRGGSWDIYAVDVDGGAGARPLLVKELDQFPESWSGDGRMLLYREMNPQTGLDIWTMSRDGDELNPLIASPGNDRFARFRPDGNWVAYTSNASGRDQVFVCAFPGCAEEQRTAGNGAEPEWSPDGATLYFRDGDRMMAVDVLDRATMRLGAPRVLFEGPYRRPEVYLDSYDIHPDGGRFLMITHTASDEIRIVENWHRELLERVPVD